MSEKKLRIVIGGEIRCKGVYENGQWADTVLMQADLRPDG